MKWHQGQRSTIGDSGPMPRWNRHGTWFGEISLNRAEQLLWRLMLRDSKREAEGVCCHVNFAQHEHAIAATDCVLAGSCNHYVRTMVSRKLPTCSWHPK